MARRAFLQLPVAGAGAFPVRERFAAEPQAEVQAALRQPAVTTTREPGPAFGVPYAADRPQVERDSIEWKPYRCGP